MSCERLACSGERSRQKYFDAQSGGAPEQGLSTDISEKAAMVATRKAALCSDLAEVGA